MHDLVHGGAADAVRLGDLAQAVSALAIPKNRLTVENQCRTADGPAFQLIT